MATRQAARQAARRRSRRARANQHKPLYRRTLRYEPLEDRRLLALVTVDTPFDTVDPDDDLTSLREAINDTNLVSGRDEITFDFGHDGPETIVLTQGELRISDDLTIEGPGAELLTIDASGNDPTPDINDGRGSRIFIIESDATLQGLMLIGGDAGEAGGAIRVSGASLLIRDAAVLGNASEDVGGGIFASSSHVEIIDSQLMNNSTNDRGRAIYIQFGDAVFTRTTIEGNSGLGARAAVFADGADFQMADSSVSNNQRGIEVSGPGAVTIIRSQITGNSSVGLRLTVQDGGTASIEESSVSNNGAGGIVLDVAPSATATISNSHIEQNASRGVVLNNRGTATIKDSTISECGGGIDVVGNLTIERTSITHNTSGGIGGGIFSHQSTVGGALTLLDSDVSNNSAFQGGGIALIGESATAHKIINSTIVANASTRATGFGGGGGGIYAQTSALEILDSTIERNTTVGSGGGVYADNAGGIIVRDSIISQNTASDGGGLWLDNGSVDRSTISQNSATRGGGIFSAVGSTTIRQTTISENNAVDGGGIQIHSGQFTLVDSTVSGNSARSRGGGIRNAGDNLTVSGSTISGNSAGTGGGIDGTSTLRFATITDNTGGGVWGDAELDHTILAGNRRMSGESLEIVAPAFRTRYSIVGFGDEFLGPLADNGGPTKTHALLPGSPAINAGDPSAVPGVDGVPEFDQRGEPFERVFDGQIDIGAIESRGVFVDTLVDESDGNYGPGDLSLREAIEFSNLNSGADTIRFDPALTAAGPATIRLTHGELHIAANLTLLGPGENLLWIDASGNDPTPSDDNGDGSSVFLIDDGRDDSIAKVVLDGLALTGGDAAYGGALLSLENLTITRSTISENSALVLGGGIAAVGGGLEVANSNIADNVTGQFGGGIAAFVDLTISASTISGNMALNGGGIHSSYGVLNLSDSHIHGNTVTGLKATGGGIHHSFGRMVVTRSRIADNSADSAGGIYSGDEATIVRSTITGNTAEEEDGGGIVAFGKLELEYSTVSRNTAGRNGGGVRATGDVTIDSSTIANNQSGRVGGGVWLRVEDMDALIINSTISGNSTQDHGSGLWTLNLRGLTKIAHSTIAENETLRPNSAGGGVFVHEGELLLDHTVVANNTAAAGSDLTGLLGSSIEARFSLIGDNSGSGLAPSPFPGPDANGNLIGGGEGGLIDPRLAPLANNGGPTMTHAPIRPFTFATIDTGDPNAVAGTDGVPVFDQRGTPFSRVMAVFLAPRIDIGAFEATREFRSFAVGDYNRDRFVDVADYVVWRKTAGMIVDAGSGADGNGDGIVDEADWQVWRMNFGRIGGSAGQGAGSGEQGAGSPDQAAVETPPQRPAWQPPPSPRVSLATTRGAFRPATQRFAPQEDPRAAIASPRAAIQGEYDSVPARRQSIRHPIVDSADGSIHAIDLAFETLGANLAGTPRLNS